MRIAILGGGISGLSLAYYLSKNSLAKVTVYEQGKPGGVIDTHLGEFFFEKGPRTFAASRCPELLSLIDELGLSHDLIYADPQTRYVLYNNKLCSLKSMMARAICKGAIRIPQKKRGEETVDAFARRRFGPWVAENLIDPMTLGIFATPAKDLSFDACFPKRKKGSKDPRLFTLKSGMHTLITALTHQGNFDIVTKRIDSLDIDADKIISTLPAYEMKRITGDARFGQISYAGLKVVNLAYDQNVLKKQGFGYLIPSHVGSNVLGVVFDSSIFPQQNRSAETRLTVMLKADGTLDDALEAVSNHLGIDAEPKILVSDYPKVIPQMGLGHRELVAAVQAESSITLAGSWISGPSVNSCITC